MNESTPRQTAVFIALVAAIIAGLGTLFFKIFDRTIILIPIIIIVLSVFILVYIFTSSYLVNLIFKKINPIYKTIQNVNLSEKDFWKDYEQKDIIKKVKKDVLAWAKRKTKEITHLRQLEKYRREFLGNVSHELKTPIFNIQGYILTLIDGGLKDPAINTLYLERTEKSVNRLISIVNDLESISRLEYGELELKIKKLNIIRLFEESFEMHEMLANECKIKLKFAKKYDKPIYILADKKRLFEAINNLIVNSIKYGNPGGTTTVSFSSIADNILIDISDNGIGISEQEIPRIFERFYRTDKSRSREMGGTGLGLSIVKHIIEAHNQTITVKSKVNEGTTFTFTMKQAF